MQTQDTTHSEKMLHQRHKRHIPELPESFIQRDKDSFYVLEDISAQEIILAAQSIVKHQLTYFPIVMSNPKLVKTLALLELANANSEVFCVLFLNNQRCLILFERMFKGTVNQVEVYPREIVKRALELNAVAVILLHNHPTGDCRPSQVDELLTQQVKLAFDILHINVLDHLIVGGSEVFSFSENGKL